MRPTLRRRHSLSQVPTCYPICMAAARSATHLPFEETFQNGPGSFTRFIYCTDDVARYRFLEIPSCQPLSGSISTASYYRASRSPCPRTMNLEYLDSGWPGPIGICRDATASLSPFLPGPTSPPISSGGAGILHTHTPSQFKSFVFSSL